MPGPNMYDSRVFAGAAVLGQDVYVAGGFNSRCGKLRSCERLHSGSWTPIASMNELRQRLAMVAIGGKLFAFGGTTEWRRVSSVECYDPERDRWDIVSQMPTDRKGLSAAQLNGLIYVCSRWNGDPLSVCERYNHEKYEWQTVASMKEERSGFSLVTANGHLYALGGFQSEKSVEMYSPTRNEWTLLRNGLIEGRWFCSAVVL